MIYYILVFTYLEKLIKRYTYETKQLNKEEMWI